MITVKEKYFDIFIPNVFLLDYVFVFTLPECSALLVASQVPQ